MNSFTFFQNLTKPSDDISIFFFAVANLDSPSSSIFTAWSTLDKPPGFTHFVIRCYPKCIQFCQIPLFCRLPIQFASKYFSLSVLASRPICIQFFPVLRPSCIQLFLKIATLHGVSNVHWVHPFDSPIFIKFYPRRRILGRVTGCAKSSCYRARHHIERLIQEQYTNPIHDCPLLSRESHGQT